MNSPRTNMHAPAPRSEPSLAEQTPAQLPTRIDTLQRVRVWSPRRRTSVDAAGIALRCALGCGALTVALAPACTEHRPSEALVSGTGGVTTVGSASSPMVAPGTGGLATASVSSVSSSSSSSSSSGARAPTRSTPDCAARAMAAKKFDPSCPEYQGYLDPGTKAGRAPTSGEVQMRYLCKTGQAPAADCKLSGFPYRSGS